MKEQGISSWRSSPSWRLSVFSRTLPYPSFKPTYGLSLKEADDRLIEAIERTYEGRFVETVYKKFTFVLKEFE